MKRAWLLLLLFCSGGAFLLQTSGVIAQDEGAAKPKPCYGPDFLGCPEPCSSLFGCIDGNPDMESDDGDPKCGERCRKDDGSLDEECYQTCAFVGHWVVLSLILIAIFGVINSIVATRRGYNFLSWFFAFGPVGAVILLTALPQSQGIPVRIKKGDTFGSILTISFFLLWFIFISSQSPTVTGVAAVLMAIFTTGFFIGFLRST